MEDTKRWICTHCGSENIEEHGMCIDCERSREQGARVIGTDIALKKIEVPCTLGDSRSD